MSAPFLAWLFSACFSSSFCLGSLFLFSALVVDVPGDGEKSEGKSQGKNEGEDSLPAQAPGTENDREQENEKEKEKESWADQVEAA